MNITLCDIILCCHYTNMPRLRVVPHFSSGIVERGKHERTWKSPHARKGDTRRGESVMSPFLVWGDFYTHSRFTRSTIPEENGGLFVVKNMPWNLPEECTHTTLFPESSPTFLQNVREGDQYRRTHSGGKAGTHTVKIFPSFCLVPFSSGPGCSNIG